MCSEHDFQTYQDTSQVFMASKGMYDIVHTVLGVHKKRVYDVHQIEHCVLTICTCMHQFLAP